MNNVVLLSRVSTASQDLTQQTNELIIAAHKAGYSDDNIIIIEDKESAVKLKFEDREGITQLLTLINTGTIDRVIVYEISRIARRADVFYKVRDLLISKRIQLQVLTPSFCMLNEDGTINENSNLLIGIFLSMAESEGRIRKARLARGKAVQKANNKWIGGTPSFGYSVDSKTHTLYINEDANLVKSIFEDYAKPQNTALTIAKDLYDRGIAHNKDLYYTKIFVLRILRNENYLGDDIYPQIISNELFEKVKVKRESAKILQRHTHASDECLAKHLFRSFNNQWVYICRASVNKYECTILKESIKIETADKFVWELTKNYKKNHITPLNIYATLNKEISNIYDVLETKNKKMNEIEEKIDKVNERYIEGFIDKDKANKMIIKFNKELEDIKHESFVLLEQLNHKEKRIEESKNPNNINFELLSNKDKQTMIYDVIERINIEHIKKYNLNLYVHYKDGSGETYYMNTFSKVWNKL